MLSEGYAFGAGEVKLKKPAITIGLLAVFLAGPVLAVGQSGDVPASIVSRVMPRPQVSYGEDAKGIKARVEALKQERVEERTAKRAEIAEVTKKVAQKRIESILKRYEKIKSRVISMPAIDSTQREIVVAKIDAEIAKVKAIKVELAAANTIDEVKAIMVKIQEQLKASAAIVKEVVAAIHATHYTKVHEKLSGVHETLTNKVEEKEAEGQNVETIKEMLLSVKENLDRAESEIDSGNISGARKSLQDARLELVKVYVEIKKISGETAEADPEDLE